MTLTLPTELSVDTETREKRERAGRLFRFSLPLGPAATAVWGWHVDRHTDSGKDGELRTQPHALAN